ncbi:ATP-binding protein [Archangium violaceum]|uniref:AlbA family DNA-binding domain-containing protein n=1 Tax=Archangium violaceum TaxID=83451 RepID=UPI002B2E7605|nr:ATP-binding protein [Archangium gephyra]
MNTSTPSGTFTKITSRDTLPSIESPETDTLDWKARVDSSNLIELAKDMAAFANASGGCIVVGVQERRNNRPAGYAFLAQNDARELARSYQEAARNYISPAVIIETALIEHERDGSNQWLLAVNISPTEAIFCGARASKERDDTWVIPQRVASNTIFLSIDAAQAKTIEKLRSATNQTLSLIEKWQDEVKQKSRIRQFEEFMESGTYYDICLPDLASDDAPLGLHYAIRPARDGHGQPLRFEDDMSDRWVVEVIGPSHASVLSDEDMKRYDASPICEGEYYYCEFYNGSWHISTGGVEDARRFYMSGMVGQPRWLQTANKFAAQNRTPSIEYTLLFEMLLDGQGKPARRGCIYLVFSDGKGSLFLQVNDSPLKSMYMTNPAKTFGDTGWYFCVDKLRGHGTPDVLSNIRESILNELQERGIQIPKIPWYSVEREDS